MSGCVTCRSNRRELHKDRTGDVICLRCYLARHREDPLTSERPRQAHSARTARRPVVAGHLVDNLNALELAPVVICLKTPIVRCLCPACGSPDSEGIWRSLLVDGRNGLAGVCNHGCTHDRIIAAFRRLINERTSHVA